MNIQIDKDHMISSDNNCWIVKRYAGIDKGTNKQKWEALSYHSTPGQAMRGLANKMIRDSKATSFLEAIEHVHEIAQKFETALSIDIPEVTYDDAKAHQSD